MSCRCTSCVWRGDPSERSKTRPGCAYIQHTGNSRLKEVYRRLGVNHMTDEVREAMKPEHCTVYKRGPRQELNEKKIALEGGLPYMRKGGEAIHHPKTRELPMQGSQGPGQEPGAAPKPKNEAKPKAAPKAAPKPRAPWIEQARELYRLGLTDGEIAKRVGTGTQNICFWRKREGLPSNYRPKRNEDFMPLYRQGLSDGEIAAATGKEKRTVQKWRARWGLPYNPCKREKACREDQRRRRELYDRGLSDREIAEETGAKISTVTSWRDNFGLTPNPGGKRGIPVSWEEDGLRLYREGKTDREIAEAVGRSVATVGEWRRKHGLALHPARPEKKRSFDSLTLAQDDSAGEPLPSAAQTPPPVGEAGEEAARGDV